MKFDRRGLLMSRGKWLVSAIAVVLSNPLTTEACSVCGGAAIGTDPGTGFNSSILFLLSMPFVVVGMIGGWLIYTYWRASGQRRKRVPVQYLVSMEQEGES
jgi:uncharacterized protein (DUF2062 family)